MTGAIVVLAALPVFTVILVRDVLLRRRIRQVMASSGSCAECGYRILGLATDAELRVTCPECGHLTVVDPAVIALINEQGVDLQRLSRPVTSKRERALSRVALWASVSFGVVLVGGVLAVVVVWQTALADYRTLMTLHRPHRVVLAKVPAADGQLVTPAEQAARTIDSAVERYRALAGPEFELFKRPSDIPALVSEEYLGTVVTLLPAPDAEVVAVIGPSPTRAELTQFADRVADRLVAGELIRSLDPLSLPSNVATKEGIPALDDASTIQLTLRLRLLSNAMTLLTRRAQQTGDNRLALDALRVRVDLERLMFGTRLDWRGASLVRQRDLISDLAFLASVARTPAEIDELLSLVTLFETDADSSAALALAELFLIDLFVWQGEAQPYNGDFTKWLVGAVNNRSTYGDYADSTSVRQFAADFVSMTQTWIRQPHTGRGDPPAIPTPPRLASTLQYVESLQAWIRGVDERGELLSPVRVCAAVRRFTLRTGKVPNLLEELVPTELAVLPPLSKPFTDYSYQRVDAAADPFGRTFLLGIRKPIAPITPGLPRIKLATPLEVWATTIAGKDEMNHPSTQRRAPVPSGAPATITPAHAPAPVEPAPETVPAVEPAPSAPN